MDQNNSLNTAAKWHAQLHEKNTVNNIMFNPSPSGDPFYKHGLILIIPWIGNQMQNKV